MFSQDSTPAPPVPDADLVRQYDGAERIPLLLLARFVTLAPSTDPRQPVDVTIEWAPDRVEKPLPGSALWRAVLESRLARPMTRDPVERLIRRQIIGSLDCYPDLETWWSGLRQGWTAPPRPERAPDRGRGLRRLLGKLRRP